MNVAPSSSVPLRTPARRSNSLVSLPISSKYSLMLVKA